MSIPIIGGLIELGKLVGKGILDNVKRKQEMKAKTHERKLEMAADKQNHNQDWELKQLENAGWKDDVLFYGIIGMFVWAGIDPDAASVFFKNIQTLPDWFIKIWFWTIASVLGVKKLGDYVPNFIQGVKTIFSKESR